MELRQLEYFMITCEKGSFNQAAECLYTTQPNVSKVISSLEKELGRPLFERSSRGIHITPYGETVREYAQNILHNISLINSLTDHNQGKKFSLATYPSNMISRLLTDFYKEMGNSYIVEHLEGTVEEISNRVAQGLSEIGIVYIAQKQLHQFQHILSHKKLKFVPLDSKEACVYVGPKHPRYHDESIDFQDLSSLSFVRGVRDFFSVEHHLNHVSLGAISTEQENPQTCRRIFPAGSPARPTMAWRTPPPPTAPFCAVPAPRTAGYSCRRSCWPQAGATACMQWIRPAPCG